ncbi:hypothetical protein D3C80_1496940 [compost metagenome]
MTCTEPGMEAIDDSTRVAEVTVAAISTGSRLVGGITAEVPWTALDGTMMNVCPSSA